MLYPIILFDLDDTLIDFSASEAISLRKIYNKFYQTIDYTVFENYYKEINDDLWKRVGAQENSLMPKDVRFLRFKYLNEILGGIASAYEVATEYELNLGEYADWIPHVKKTIEFLHQKGHILGIITNGLSDSQSKKRRRLGLHHWFDCFIVSDEVGIAKPNKEIFDIALKEIAKKRHHLPPVYDKNSILMVGDSIISDGYGAMNFGISYCHINRLMKAIPNDVKITYHIKSVSQLPACIGYATEYEHFLNLQEA
jgi:2-haloacid dehalogenase